MNKHVIIKMNSVQDDGFNKDKTEFLSEGKFYKKGSVYYVSYKETELTGFDGNTTVLKIEADKITMTRFGPNNTHMIFKKGENHTCCYETPYGSVTIDIYANNIGVNVDDMGGNIFADYDIKVNNETMSRNNFKLEIKHTAV